MPAVDVNEDDPSIRDEAILLRRLPRDWVVWDANRGSHRVTSQAFQNLPGKNAFSAFLETECLGIESILEGYDGYGIASFSVGHVRTCGQGVVRIEETLPGHAHVIGDKPRRVRKLLSGKAIVVHKPTG